MSKTNNKQTEKNKKNKQRRLKGIVVSDKMQKTAVVEVERMKFHSKYKKYYLTSRRFKANNKGNEYHIGDKVIIESTKPLSKDKKWRIISRA